MQLNIEGKDVEIFPGDKNIVDVADREKIGIPAPCYRNNRNKGCCRSCVVEIDGRNEYACATKPVEGMIIIVRRKDLDELRKQRIIKYREGMATGSNECCCNSPENESRCC